MVEIGGYISFLLEGGMKSEMFCFVWAFRVIFKFVFNFPTKDRTEIIGLLSAHGQNGIKTPLGPHTHEYLSATHQKQQKQYLTGNRYQKPVI